MAFVPDDFDPPLAFEGPGFRLEPLGPEHNERDHEAWMSSIDHIRATPGAWKGWPEPMSLEKNLADLVMHANEFVARTSFTYSVLDGDDVIGCLYIYPDEEPGSDAKVKSWVTASRAEMDEVVWASVRSWLDDDWPFDSFRYAPRG
ncbi:MAG: N-acetyltransferase [Acidimicrobiia bacterium]|nr:N-acetyltransferase [Acidimicrobiia bacterium]